MDSKAFLNKIKMGLDSDTSFMHKMRSGKFDAANAEQAYSNRIHRSEVLKAIR
jgi:hypothetical protein